MVAPYLAIVALENYFAGVAVGTMEVECSPCQPSIVAVGALGGLHMDCFLLLLDSLVPEMVNLGVCSR